MSEVAVLTIADSAISAGAVIAIVIILAVLVLSVSLWLFRQRLRYQRDVLSRRQLIKKCPYCGTAMDPAASYCPNCGKQVPQVTTVT